MLSLLAILWFSLADVPTAHRDLPLLGVDRPTSVVFPRPTKTPEVRYLPSKVGVQLDIDIDPTAATAALHALPPPFETSVEPGEYGLRIRIVHPDAVIRAHKLISGQSFVLEIGPRSEETSLRVLAALVSSPLPEPRDLGAHRELWLDAERATADGDLWLARRLWDKLEQTSHLDDLATLRTADLYLMSGHVNEALSRLRQVSRRYPRSTGASLARLDLLHVEAITGVSEPAYDQIALAAQTVDRRAFESHAWMRASLILDAIGESNLAISRMPALDDLVPFWQAPARVELERMLEIAVAGPTLRGDPNGTLIAWEAWGEKLDDHPHRVDLVDLVTDAYCHVGLFDAAIPLLRQRLRDLPKAIDEGPILFLLASAYHNLEDVEREAEVVTFLLRGHASAPQVPALARGLAVNTQQQHGLPAARTQLAELRKKRIPGSLRAALWSIEADLVSAYGDDAVQAQVLGEFEKVGFDDPTTRGPQLALALARMGRAEQAAPRLRSWVGQTTDPERRDELAYHLAQSELALGHDADADRILELLSRSGSRYGLIARTQVRARSLRQLLDHLEATPLPGEL